MGRSNVFVGVMVAALALETGCESADDSTQAAASAPDENVEQRLDAARRYWGAAAQAARVFSSDSAADWDSRSVAVSQLCAEQLAGSWPGKNEYRAMCDATSALGKLRSSPPEKPETPEKPTFEKPKYDGVYKINGKLRGPYDGGGVVIETSSTYYLLENGTMPRGPYVTRLHGYVEDAGRTITLAIGRDGRDTKVVRVSDKETFLDDRREYKRTVLEAKAAHKEAMTTYKAALRAHPERLKRYQEALKARAGELNAARRRLVAAVQAFLNAVEHDAGFERAIAKVEGH